MAEVAVGFLGEFPPGAMKAVRVGNLNIVVFRNTEGTISALEDRCSHADVRLSAGKFSNGEVECAAHGARFDVKTGKHLCMPAVRGVKSFATRVEGETLYVAVP